jgi:putative transposase
MDDLSRQIEYLRQPTEYSDFILITDIGSGINFKRKGLQTILDSCIQGIIETIIIAQRDRLCRFGYDLLESVVTKSGGGLSKSWMTIKTKVPNKNSQKTFYQSSASTAVAKWEKEATQKFIKSRKILLKLSSTQNEKIDRWIHTSRYVYNKTVYYKNNHCSGSKLDARNFFVTKKNNEHI